jgi:tRNA dimethylallyltransferase
LSLAPGLSARRIVAIVGPTACGKSDLAIEAALRLGGEVISFDSVQVYRGLDIGSGKPSASDRAKVAHHLIDCLDLGDEVNAALLSAMAARTIEDVLGRRGFPVLVGGTGLYLTALLKGLFPEGEVDPSVRARLDVLLARHGTRRLHRLLEHVDPEYAARTQPADAIRVVRALEICFGQGRTFTEAQKGRVPAWTGETLVVGIDPDRLALRARVEARVAVMFARGLIEETKAARELSRECAKVPRVLQAIGYREVMARLDREPHLERADDELLRAIVNSTMQYAKRQMTYFRRQFAVEWFRSPADALARIVTFAGAARAGA